MSVLQSLVSKTQREARSPAQLTDGQIFLSTRKVNIVQLPQNPTQGCGAQHPQCPEVSGGRQLGSRAWEGGGLWPELGFFSSAPGRASPGGGSCGTALPAPCWRGDEMGSSGACCSRWELVKMALLWFGESAPPQDDLSETPLQALASRAFASQKRTCGHHPLLTTAYLNNLLAGNNKF